jgi:hypothetical protein
LLRMYSTHARVYSLEIFRAVAQTQHFNSSRTLRTAGAGFPFQRQVLAK